METILHKTKADEFVLVDIWEDGECPETQDFYTGKISKPTGVVLCINPSDHARGRSKFYGGSHKSFQSVSDAKQWIGTDEFNDEVRYVLKLKSEFREVVKTQKQQQILLLLSGKFKHICHSQRGILEWEDAIAVDETMDEFKNCNCQFIKEKMKA